MIVARKERRRGRAILEPDVYMSFAVFCGIGLAAWRLDQPMRLALLWVTLLAFTLAYASGRRVVLSYSSSELARGALIGLLVSVPLVVSARDFLLVTAQRVFAVDDTLMVLGWLIFIMPVVEALYFRGYVQREEGLGTAVLLYMAAAVVYYLPATLTGFVPVLGALVVGMGLLGFVYGYVRNLYGFAASLACQTTVHFVLFILPLLPQEFARSLV